MDTSRIDKMDTSCIWKIEEKLRSAVESTIAASGVREADDVAWVRRAASQPKIEIGGSTLSEEEVPMYKPIIKKYQRPPGASFLKDWPRQRTEAPAAVEEAPGKYHRKRRMLLQCGLEKVDEGDDVFTNGFIRVRFRQD